MNPKRDGWWTALVFRVGRRYANGLDSVADRRAFAKRATKRIRSCRVYSLTGNAVFMLGPFVILSIGIQSWVSWVWIALGGALLGIIAPIAAAIVVLLMHRKYVQCVVREELNAIEVPTCLRCGYCLLGTENPLCPECGCERTAGEEQWRRAHR